MEEDYNSMFQEYAYINKLLIDKRRIQLSEANSNITDRKLDYNDALLLAIEIEHMSNYKDTLDKRLSLLKVKLGKV